MAAGDYENRIQKIKLYVDNPGMYVDELYRADPDTYLGVPVYQQFMESFGRAPTANELAVFSPYVVSMGHQGAKQYIAQYALTQNAATDEQKRLDEKAPEYYGSVGDVFNELMKRGATQSELEHFGREMAAGNLDAYTLRQFVQSMPEYQTTQDQAMRDALSTELQGYDQKFFNKGKEDIISRYAAMGRTGSSSLDYALTDMLGQIADKRGEWMANLSAQQYGGNKANARSDYEATMNKYLNDQAYSRAQMDALTQRGWNISDYDRQARDYARYAGGQQQMPWGSLIGGAVGAGIGAFGGPLGATAGWSIGSGLGGGYDYYNRTR